MTGPVTLADLIEADKLLWVLLLRLLPRARRGPGDSAAARRHTRARCGQAHEVL